MVNTQGSNEEPQNKRGAHGRYEQRALNKQARRMRRSPRFFYSVKNRMILAFSALLMTALLIVQITNYYQFTYEIEHSIVSAVINSLEMGLGRIEAQLLEAESFGISTMVEELVQNALTDPPGKTTFDHDIMRRRLSNLLKNSIRAKTSLYKAYLINSNGEALDTVISVIPSPVLSAITMGYPQENRPYVTGIHREFHEDIRIDVVSLIRRVYRSSHTADEIGLLVMDIDAGIIERSLKDFELPGSGYLLLVNDNDELLYFEGESLLNSPGGKSLALSITGADLPLKGSALFDIEGRRYMCVSYGSDIFGWRLIAAMSYDSLMRPTRQNRNITFVLMGLCIIIAVVLSSVIVNRMSKPITMLLKSMKEVETGNFESVVNYSGGDEMQQLVDGYNSMTAKMGSLIDRVKHEEEDKRNAELYVLQAQINPHFLYNALNSIRYLAREQGADEIGRITVSLINLSRASLDSGKFITIKQEMDLVWNYLEIMKIRCGDIFHYNYDMETAREFESCVIPRFSIQPLIENAVFHGILPKGQGEIAVKICPHETGGILIEVRDTGLGIEQEELSFIRAELSAQTISWEAGTKPPRASRQPMKHIGLKNIDNRIKRYFAAEDKAHVQPEAAKNYGLFINSGPEEGTVVRLYIPKWREPERL